MGSDPYFNQSLFFLNSVNAVQPYHSFSLIVWCSVDTFFLVCNIWSVSKFMLFILGFTNVMRLKYIPLICLGFRQILSIWIYFYCLFLQSFLQLFLCFISIAFSCYKSAIIFILGSWVSHLWIYPPCLIYFAYGFHFFKLLLFLVRYYFHLFFPEY